MKDKGAFEGERKNVSLVGFDKLSEEELETVKQIMSSHIGKLENRTDYTELRIRLKIHQHEKSFIHELEADLFIPGRQLGVKISHKNLYKALALTMSKLISEIDHYLKKKSPGNRPIRKK
jgi:ribosome-associated translation inhibitor RaiA